MLQSKACAEYRKSLKEDTVFTFDGYFQEKLTLPEKVDKIQIDECFATPLKWINILYRLKRKNPNMIIQMFGDPNQCEPVCKFNRYFNYLYKKAIKYLCGNNIMKKKYIEESSRYDKDLNNALKEVIKTGMLPKQLQSMPADNTILENIVMRNDLRDRFNNKFGKEWTIGMRLIAEDNIKTKKIYKSAFYTIAELGDNTVTVKNDLGEQLGPFRRSLFIPTFAVTVWKYQGAVIEGHYNIRQTNIMNRNQLYTALSRGRKLSNIHIEWTDKKFEFACEPKEATILNINNAKIGFIYRMVNEEAKAHYVGLTTTTIEQREQEHKDKQDDPIHKYDGEWVTEEVAQVHYFDEKKLRKVETSYINYYAKNKEYHLANTQKVDKEIPQPEILIGNVDDTIKENLKVEEGPNYFRIRYRANGVNIDVKKQYGVKVSKEQALKAINEKKKELELEFFN